MPALFFPQGCRNDQGALVESYRSPKDLSIALILRLTSGLALYPDPPQAPIPSIPAEGGALKL